MRHNICVHMCRDAYTKTRRNPGGRGFQATPGSASTRTALPDESLEVYNRISAPGFCVLVLKPYGKRHSDTSVHMIHKRVTPGLALSLSRSPAPRRLRSGSARHRLYATLYRSQAQSHKRLVTSTECTWHPHRARRPSVQSGVTPRHARTAGVGILVLCCFTITPMITPRVAGALTCGPRVVALNDQPRAAGGEPQGSPSTP